MTIEQEAQKARPMTEQHDEPVEVTQADRDAAVFLFTAPDDRACLAGQLDHTAAVKAFARHRLAARPTPSSDMVEAMALWHKAFDAYEGCATQSVGDDEKAAATVIAKAMAAKPSDDIGRDMAAKIVELNVALRQAEEAMAAKDAELAELRARVRVLEDELNQPLAMPIDIAEALVAIGEAEWGATEEKDAQGHAESVRNSVELTSAHFGQTGVQKMHGVYIKGDDTVICHTGTSPNSGQHARVITAAWNFMLDHARAALGSAEG